MSEETPLDQAALERKAKRELAALRRKLRPALDTTLSNESGIDRVRAIPDEAWQIAVNAEDEDDAA